jgi:hypothetical protein
VKEIQNKVRQYNKSALRNSNANRSFQNGAKLEPIRKSEERDLAIEISK